MKCRKAKKLAMKSVSKAEACGVLYEGLETSEGKKEKKYTGDKRRHQKRYNMYSK